MLLYKRVKEIKKQESRPPDDEIKVTNPVYAEQIKKHEPSTREKSKAKPKKT